MTDIREADIFTSIDDQKRHWYYYTKISVIADNIREYLKEWPYELPLYCLDIGSGSGIISQGLSDRFPSIDWRWTATDPGYSNEEIAESPKNYKKTRSIPRREYDLIIAADVLEHIEDDSAMVKLIHERLSPCAIAVLTVPALNCLWSSHDDYLGHYRRYKLKQLIKLFHNCGMRDMASGYIFSMLLPVAALTRWKEKFPLFSATKKNKSQMRATNKFLNNFLISLMIIEAKLKRRWPNYLGKILGISAFMVCQNACRADENS